MNTKEWQKILSLPADHAISGLSGIERLWVCTPAGLYRETEDGFQPQLHLPFQGASAVLAWGKSVLAAGYPHQIARSPDEGRTWFGSRAEQISALATCFVASPNFSQDATILAGSDGEGVLRSTDGGSSWQLSNFGLGSLNILALACAPRWEREAAPNAVAYQYEYVFAATEAGVYRSPNAGRAWRFAGQGLPDIPVLSLAASPDFTPTPSLSGAHFRGVVFAGSDGAGLYRSQDGGQVWQRLASFPPDATVNAILFDSLGRLLAGTGEQGLLVSVDLGATWTSLIASDEVILCLAEQGRRLLAGTAEGGLLAGEL